MSTDEREEPVTNDHETDDHAERVVRGSRRSMPIVLGAVAGVIALTGLIFGVIKDQPMTALLNGFLLLGIIALFAAIRWMRNYERRP